MKGYKGEETSILRVGKREEEEFIVPRTLGGRVKIKKKKKG